MENPSHSYKASTAIWDHTVFTLSATWHRWMCRASTLARQTGTRFTNPGGMEGWVDFDVGYILRWFTCPQKITYPNSNHLEAAKP